VPGDLLLAALVVPELLGLRLGTDAVTLARLELAGELLDRRLEARHHVVTELAGLHDAVVDALVRAADEVKELALEAEHVADRHLIQVAVGAGPDRGDLALHGVRRVLRLLEQLDQARAALELRLGSLVEV